MASSLVKTPRRLAAALAMLAPLLAFAADRPVMAVAFEVTSPTFQRTLPELPAAQQSLAERLAAELSPHFAFAQWRAGPPAGPVMGTLIARLAEVAAAPFPRVEVSWVLKLPSGEIVALPLPTALVYAATNPNWDTSNRLRFETRVFDETMKVVRTGGFYELAFNEVLRKLPIATAVMPVESDHVVLVPLPWKQLRLGQGSEVAVRFTKVGAQGEKQGSLQLAQINERGRKPGLGFVQGGVKEAIFDSQALVLNEHWNASLTSLLANATVRCFLTVYESAEFSDAEPGRPILDPN
jgi:hypothetical protein